MRAAIYRDQHRGGAVADGRGLVHGNPQVLAGAFLNEHTPDAAACSLCRPLVAIAGIFQLVDGLQAIASGLLRG